MKVKLLNEDAKLPTYATDGSNGFDLYATNAATIHPGTAETIGTGIAVEIQRHHTLLLFSRSGMGFSHGLRLANCVGVVDADFRSEIKVRIHNDGDKPYAIGIGDRVAQGMVIPVLRYPIEQVSELSATLRAGGFGSSGK